MSLDFNTTTHGKWILAGEHSIVRGGKALVFPIKSKQLHLSYETTQSALSADFSGDSGNDTHLLFWSVLEHGMQQLGLSINSLSGHFNLDNTIPIGAGMGASAALCVAVSRWFVWKEFIKKQELSQFATELEHLFHGKSSGLDIAGCNAETGILFDEGKITAIDNLWQPFWYLSFCGQIGITSHCVKKVKTLVEENPAQGQKIDEQMNEAVMLAYDALSNSNDLQNLTTAIETAGDCFKQWGLISNTMQNHIDELKASGAIAAKPTGSGDGGFVLSLWKNQTQLQNIELLAV